MVYRSASSAELALLSFLICGAKSAENLHGFLSGLKVANMEDGGMGSLRLLQEGVDTGNAKFGREVSSCEFTDEDGVKVIASLYLDQMGNLFELDIWKTNFVRLVRIPANQDEMRMLVS